MNPRLLQIFLGSLSLLLALSVVGSEAPKCAEAPGLSELLGPGAVVLLGEIHGSEQAPAFAGNAVCLAVASGLPVKVALEVPRDQAEYFETFLASQGSEADRGALLSSPFWSKENRDGRSSAAFLAMLDDLRRLQAAGNTVVPVLFDTPESSGENRESEMGTYLADAMAKDPRSQWIAFTGNIHSRVSQGVPWDAEFMPMGTYLVKALEGRKITALDISHSGGEAWVCLGDAAGCGPQPMRPRAEPGEGWRVELDGPEPNRHGHHGRYFVGELTASMPALQSP